MADHQHTDICHLIEQAQHRSPENMALIYKQQEYNYRALYQAILTQAAQYLEYGIDAGDRVAIYLPKTPAAVIAMFAANAIGAVFVPINPLLKKQQIQHILDDSGASLLVVNTHGEKALAQVHATKTLVIGDTTNTSLGTNIKLRLNNNQDLAAILYTSGSTGYAKGVMLSHHNLVIGAASVTQYLENRPGDRLLAVLPFSFDYGLSQLTTAFTVGASVVLMDYLFPKDIIKAVTRHSITGLALIPTLWNQLIKLSWPEVAQQSLRYITSSGGSLPVTTTETLQTLLPDTKLFPMYGLTEAFRATYLAPEQVKLRPTSIGKAIPHAEILVLDEQGETCTPEQPGELVQTGPHVALGYWNNPAATAQCFKPVKLKNNEIGVYSGDLVKQDAEGYLYFVGRKDHQIKTTGYRVSPQEVESVALKLPHVLQAAAIGVTDTMIGQAILLVLETDDKIDSQKLKRHYREHLPDYMHPKYLAILDSVPRTHNHKLDIPLLTQQYNEQQLPLNADW